jgi:HEAT repeat protein
MRHLIIFTFVVLSGCLSVLALSAESQPMREPHSNTRQNTYDVDTRAVLALLPKLKTETAREEALQQLKKMPRPKLVEIFRKLLRDGEDRKIGEEIEDLMSAISILKMVELFPEVLSLAQHQSSWPVFNTLGNLATTDAQQSQVNVLLLSRLSAKKNRLDSASRHAIVTGLTIRKVALSSALFDRLMEDESSAVRDSAILQFLVSRDQLKNSEQVRRFKKAFAADPYQVRLDAYIGFSHLEKAEKKKLSKAFDEKHCLLEKQPRVKEACDAIVHDSARSGSS